MENIKDSPKGYSDTKNNPQKQALSRDSEQLEAVGLESNLRIYFA